MNGGRRGPAEFAFRSRVYGVARPCRVIILFVSTLTIKTVHNIVWMDARKKKTIDGDVVIGVLNSGGMSSKYRKECQREEHSMGAVPRQEEINGLEVMY